MKGFVAIIFLFFLLGAPPAHAITMTNSDYILQTDIIVVPREKKVKTAVPSEQVLETPQAKVGENYEVRLGFDYLPQTSPFSFSGSSLFLEYGSLIPGEPIIRTSTLTISNLSAPGYQVTASENHPLRLRSSEASPLQREESSQGLTIPDTTCDSSNCTEITSAAWASPLTYGFGYRCEGLPSTDCSKGFSQKNFFKQFASIEARKKERLVMADKIGKNRKVQVTYKVNISSNQQQGIYQNVIKYIAVPTF